MRHLSLLVIVLMSVAPGQAQAESPGDAGIALVITYDVAARDRPALRNSLDQDQLQRLAIWKEHGVVLHFNLLFGSYADAGSWDAIAVLSFKDADALARWKQIERTAPGGLDPPLLGPIDSIETAQVDLHRTRTVDRPARDSAYLVIPYDYLVSLDEYKRYFDGYVLPQLDGWIEEDALRSYALYIARHGAGRPWAALLVLEYWDEAALQRRPAVTAKVRQRLVGDPTWSALAANKQKIREEGRITVAESLGRDRY